MEINWTELDRIKPFSCANTAKNNDQGSVWVNIPYCNAVKLNCLKMSLKVSVRRLIWEQSVNDLKFNDTTDLMQDSFEQCSIWCDKFVCTALHL